MGVSCKFNEDWTVGSAVQITQEVLSGCFSRVAHPADCYPGQHRPAEKVAGQNDENPQEALEFIQEETARMARLERSVLLRG